MDAKQLIADIFATIDSGDCRRVSELIHEDYVEHNSPLGGEARGPEGFLAETRQCAGAFSEGHSEIDLLVAEGDLAVWCSTFTCVHTGELMGVPPTGRRVSFEILNIGRMKDGKALEHWGQADVGAPMARLGVSQAA